MTSRSVRLLTRLLPLITTSTTVWVATSCTPTAETSNADPKNAGTSTTGTVTTTTVPITSSSISRPITRPVAPVSSTPASHPSAIPTPPDPDRLFCYEAGGGMPTSGSKYPPLPCLPMKDAPNLKFDHLTAGPFEVARGGWTQCCYDGVGAYTGPIPGRPLIIARRGITASLRGRAWGGE